MTENNNGGRRNRQAPGPSHPRFKRFASYLLCASAACIALLGGLFYIESKGLPSGVPFGTSDSRTLIGGFSVSLLLAPVFSRILRSFQLHASPKQCLSFSAVVGMGYLGLAAVHFGTAQFLLSGELWMQILNPLKFLESLCLVYLIGTCMGFAYIAQAYPVLATSGAAVGLIYYVMLDKYSMDES